MQEQVPERTIAPLMQRSSPIHDETLEEYVRQIDKGKRSPQPLPDFRTESLGEVRTWAKNGKSFLVAAAVARYQIPDAEAKKILALALENNAGYLKSQPMYPNMQARLNPEINWMRNAAKRLLGEDF